MSKHIFLDLHFQILNCSNHICFLLIIVHLSIESSEWCYYLLLLLLHSLYIVQYLILTLLKALYITNNNNTTQITKSTLLFMEDS
jgi:hypothetical protein